MAYQPLPSDNDVERALSFCTTVESREFFYNTMKERTKGSDLSERSVPIIESQKEVNTLSESALNHNADAWSQPEKYLSYAYFKSKETLASADMNSDRKERYQQVMQQIEEKSDASDVSLDKNLAQPWLEEEKSFHQLQDNFVDWYHQAKQAPEDLDIEALVEGPFKQISSLAAEETASEERRRDEV